MVVDPAGEIVAANPLATALTGIEPAVSHRERTLAWRHFSGAPSRLQPTDVEGAMTEQAMVAELRDALGRYPADERLRALIKDLLELSPRFAELWARPSVARNHARIKTFIHPEVGAITLDCDVLSVQGTDLQVIVYTAAPGAPAAEALQLLGAIGTQRFVA